MRDKPLKGIRVLDLTRLLPGPVCTLHLADFGADVIKVEDTGAGDYARGLGVPTGRLAPVFIAINRNKKSMSVDLKKKAGKQIFERLLKTADVVIEGFRPGVMDRLGFDYQSCSLINPRIVYCSISGYGQNGPYKYKAGHDINYIGYAGVLDQIGISGGPPALANIQIGDILGGALVPAMSILAVLLEAQRTGRGRHIDVSMTDAVISHNYQALGSLVAKGSAGERGADLLSGKVPCYGVYKTKDHKYVAVGALERKFWDNLCDVIDRPHLKNHHWENDSADFEMGKKELSKVFAAEAQAHWKKVFEQEDCCVTPIISLDEAVNDPQIENRGMIFATDHPVSGRSLQFSAPFKMSDYQVSEDIPAPKQGEHTEIILEELGFSAEEIEQFDDAVKFS